MWVVQKLEWFINLYSWKNQVEGFTKFGMVHQFVDEKSNTWLGTHRPNYLVPNSSTFASRYHHHGHVLSISPESSLGAPSIDQLMARLTRISVQGCGHFKRPSHGIIQRCSATEAVMLGCQKIGRFVATPPRHLGYVPALFIVCFQQNTSHLITSHRLLS